MDEVLTDENFVLYCAKHYDNTQCSSTKEFFDDLKRIKYIKKLITRYEASDDLKERLLLNHIIILNNVFGSYHVNKILYFKLKDKFHIIKPFLVLLNIQKDTIHNVFDPGEVDLTAIKMDQNIVEVLRKI